MGQSLNAEVIVLGAGTMGTAAAWALARRGVDVIAIDQFSHYNYFSSHSGNTRIFRHCYFEGEAYVPWSLQADAMLTELANRTGIELQIRNGCLDIGTEENGQARKARASALAHNLPYEFLTGSEVNERFPAWNLPSDWEANFDPEGGVLLVENVFNAFRQELEAAGGRIVENTRVTDWSASESGVEVRTSDGTYTGKQLIVTAGAWAGKMLKDLDLPLVPVRKPVLWMDVEDTRLFAPEKFPSFIIDCDFDVPYGLPAVGGDSLKVGNHSDMNRVDPDDFSREVLPGDVTDEFMQFFATNMHGVHPRTSKTAMCMYTMTPDEDFIIDRHPQHGNVCMAAGFSGHGFKFAPMVGEHLADLATSNSAEAIPMFQIARFN